jgi:glycosyltransferase involved in cell wall biosynthesis
VSSRPVLSICIPTFNRAAHLSNCLHSVATNAVAGMSDVQVCVSDNGSADATDTVIADAAKTLPIKRHRHSQNVGFARNLLSVVEMAEGEYVWVLGDDDLLVPGAVTDVLAMLRSNTDIDYFFVNASHLESAHVMSFPQPFDIANLPARMRPFSSRTETGRVAFIELIDPKVSFDFLGAIFLSVFKRDKWLANRHVLNPEAIADTRVFANFDNTFPQIKLHAHAFARSTAYFCATPKSVCLLGARGWGRMAGFLKSVRLVEAVVEYRRNGLPLFRYLRCRNSALNSFGPDFMRMLADKDGSGYQFISNPLRLIASNMLFPNFYLSFLYPLFRRSFWRRVWPGGLVISRG